MVATSQPLAAQAGLFVLREGGTAADAAIATAAALTVLEPTSNGIGGDNFALLWHGGELLGLNASGAAPARLTLDALNGQPMPRHGWTPVTIPGAVRGWADLHARAGRLPFARLLEPAIHYARQGYPLSPEVARHWARAAQIYGAVASPQFSEWFKVFMPPGFIPAPGAVWASEAHARTLELMAASGGEDFYTGQTAQRIHDAGQAAGGHLSGDDLAGHASEWVRPISARYGDHEIWELPPNGQGVVALIALGVLDKLELPPGRDDPASLHRQIEAVKLAFADAHRSLGDPRQVEVPVEQWLSEAHQNELRSLIGSSARDPQTDSPGSGGTVYLATADGQGNMVSFIQSNYMGFGSGVVVPGTGVALHNRGHNFSLQAGHPNVLAPGKRPYHTIIPGFLTRQGRPVGPFGVMGGFMQPQGHVQVVLNTLRSGLNPQAALDAPRWQWLGGQRVEVEPELGGEVRSALSARGHQVSVQPERASFGRGQIIWRGEHGVLMGGSESRADGQVAAF
ncbi:gamma-glutamyltransferase family protein [Deinococcus sp.]|uniref:gamma-glutamyltransferase family protein n=1 Tax=Deinococcus sp. TaxID=47478 RepID=UPI0025E0B949|nr:gamma-glutamyltransferase family protein [Deinococcus sp.]